MSANDSTEFQLSSGRDKAQTNINAPAKGREEEVWQEVNIDFNSNCLRAEGGKKAFPMLVRCQRFTQYVSNKHVVQVLIERLIIFLVKQSLHPLSAYLIFIKAGDKTHYQTSRLHSKPDCLWPITRHPFFSALRTHFPNRDVFLIILCAAEQRVNLTLFKAWSPSACSSPTLECNWLLSDVLISYWVFALICLKIPRNL